MPDASSNDSVDQLHAERLAQLKKLCPMRLRGIEPLPGHVLKLWTACDIDPLLEDLSQKPDDHPDILDERMPYWAELWPSATELAAAVLDSQAENRPSGPWVELGCGPGLAGLAAASVGVQGTFTDYQPEALQLADLNALENLGRLLPTHLLDWRHPTEDLKTNWILASDVAYETRNFEPLVSCFDTLLTSDGVIWFAEPGRPMCRDFFALLTSRGWVYNTLRKTGSIQVYQILRQTAH